MKKIAVFFLTLMLFWTPLHADGSYIVISGNDGNVLEAENEHEVRSIASISKIMTAVVALENGDYIDQWIIGDEVTNVTGSMIWIQKGQQVSMRSLLYGMMLKSGNDAAVAIAHRVGGGSVEKFIQMMNEKARQIGALNSNFVTPNGLPDDNHYTTAYDLYLIFKEAVKHEEFVDTVSSKDYTMTYTTAKKTQINEYMQSTNYYLLNEFPVPEGVVMYGGKTGTTSMAKSCLILMTKNKKGERFFSVVLGAETKEALYSSMTRLLEKTTN